jgi:transposase
MKRQAMVDAKFRMPDAIWERMELLLPKRRKSKLGGRPALEWRPIIDGIFYILRTGCQWKAIPKCFGSGSSAHRYFQKLVRKGFFTQLWAVALLEYDDLVGLEWKWQAMDGALTKAPLGGEKNRGKPNRSGQAGHQAQRLDRWSGHPDQRGRLRSQHARHASGGSDTFERTDLGPRPRGDAAAFVFGQGLRLSDRATNGGRVRLHSSHPVPRRGASTTA